MSSTRSKNNSISVVIPVYQSEGSLQNLIARTKAVLEKVCLHYEIIMVEDGGRDRSWEIIQQLAIEEDHVHGIHLARNFGQHNALLCGIRHAQYETIVTLDDDLQNPPEEIPLLLEKLDEGYEVVYGRPAQQQHGFLRNVASELTKIVLKKSMGNETARHISAFRAFRTKIRKAFVNYNGSFISIDVLLTWGTTKFIAIPVKHSPREIGQSNYTLSKLLTHAVNMLVGFSSVPLQLASMMGFALTLFGFGIFVFVIGRWMLQGSVVPGFVFLASIIVIFSGAQLFALGIIGEYLARIHFRSMDKPAYVIGSEVARKEKMASL